MTECSAAATYLRLSDTSASDDRQSGVTYDPPYCYFEGRSLKFNGNGKNRGSCTNSDKCLCKTGPQASTTTAKATTTKQAPATTKWAPATTTKVQGSYAKGQMGSSSCPPGTQHIKSEADCQAASEQLLIDEFGFRRSEDEANWLQGCYALEGKGVYYNIQSQAAPGSGVNGNPRSFPICTSIPR